MSDDDIVDENILHHLKAQASQKRQHAGFFTWHDRSARGKGIAEAGIVNDLLTAMETQHEREYRNLGPSGEREQWPDVWLEDSAERRIPCEVTELVDKQSLPAGNPRPEVLEELVQRLQAILMRKGMRSVGGRSGDKSVLVIHSDEFFLNADTVAPLLSTAVFKQPSTILRAFLLLSYDPGRGGYRFFELHLEPSRS